MTIHSNTPSAPITFYKLSRNFVGGCVFVMLLLIASLPLTLFALLSLRTEAEIQS
ncbi:MAG: hypothetical protein HC835_04535 [Oscillatoriales cyanobacterium RM2_1_1]|nr:hypothetical protein [Oscillatoriales cyanobacterium SM2_3_0]NJO44937.1 hypothetical protein [Oscillatoriales cyanobacterium RM2_1_1]